MGCSYRVKYKFGELEIEVESDDKSYVDAKLNELLSKQVIAAPSKKTTSKRSSTTKKKKTPNNNNSNQGAEDTIELASIIDAINDSDDHSKIEENILNKSGQLQKIIMCLYFAQETLKVPLTTGHIQTITDQLGIRVSSTNGGTTIKSNLKYFSSDSVRKKGAIIKYKLNRKGNEAFQKIINGQKI